MVKAIEYGNVASLEADTVSLTAVGTLPFFIELRYFEGRIGLAITGLISAVALQLTSASELPNVGYMVLLDKIYNLSYFVIFIALAESVIAVKMNDAGKVLQAKKLDSVGFWICVVVFFGGSALVTVAR